MYRTNSCSIEQVIEEFRSVTKKSNKVSELEEAKRRVESLVEELRSCSESKEVSPLYDELQDILMELTVRIETLTSRCKPLLF